MLFSKSLLQNIITSTLFGGTGSMLIGFLFFQQKIFWYHYPTFQFIIYGFSFAFLYSILIYTNNVKYLIATICVLIFNVITARSFLFNYVLRDFAFIFVLSIALYSINIIMHKLKSDLLIFRVITWSCIFCVGYTISGIILIFIHKHEIVIRAIPTYLKFGLLIGLGISIGLELKKLLLNRSPA